MSFPLKKYSDQIISPPGRGYHGLHIRSDSNGSKCKFSTPQFRAILLGIEPEISDLNVNRFTKKGTYHSYKTSQKYVSHPSLLQLASLYRRYVGYSLISANSLACQSLSHLSPQQNCLGFILRVSLE